MRKTKTVSKILGGTADNADAQTLFNGMMGEGEPEIHIVHPKYVRMIKNIKSIMVVISIFSSSSFISPQDKEQLKKFHDNTILSEGDLWTHAIDEIKWKVAGLMTDKEKADFVAVYKKLKGSKTVKEFIKTCNIIAPYKTELSAGSHSWIFDNNDITFHPFSFVPTFDIKSPFVGDATTSSSQGEGEEEERRTRITDLMFKIFKCGYSLYKDVTNPDIDIDKFVEVIGSKMKAMRNIPELNRCSKAFDMIDGSIGKLKDNFGNYYRDFVTTKNPTIMIEHFILDVAKDSEGGSDPETVQQYRRIINYYKKMSAMHKQNGTFKGEDKAESLINAINGHLNTIDPDTSNLAGL